MTLTFDIDLHRVGEQTSIKLRKRHPKYLSQRSFCSKVIARDTHTHTVTPDVLLYRDY